MNGALSTELGAFLFRNVNIRYASRNGCDGGPERPGELHHFDLAVPMRHGMRSRATPCNHFLHARRTPQKRHHLRMRLHEYTGR